MEGSINIQMPTSWNQLTAKQLLFISKLFIRGLTEAEFLSLAVIKLTGLRVVDKESDPLQHVFKKDGKKFTMNVYQFHTFCNEARFLLEEPEFDKQLFPMIRIGLRRYYGPADRLMNMTFGEWLQTDIFFRHYQRTKERKFLEMAVACMYRTRDRKKIRSKHYDGDPRVTFNEYLVEKQAIKFRRVPMAKLKAISVFFSGSMKKLKNMYPLTLDGVSSSAQESNLMKDTLAIIDQLNNEDVTKNSDVQRTRLYEVLTRLEITRDMARKIREKANKK
jgi:hypothetical protein